MVQKALTYLPSLRGYSHFTEEEVKLVKKALHKRCLICGNIFFAKNINRKICYSFECEKERGRRRAQQPPQASFDNISDKKIREIYKRVRALPRARNKGYLSLSEAENKYRVSKYKIIYLAKRGVISTYQSHYKKWHGRPAKVYDEDEIAIIGEVSGCN